MREKRIKVLLVEDNPGDARLFWEMLTTSEEEQFDVITVDSLAKALETLTKEHIDVVILDLELPDSLGLDTFASVFSLVPQIPIIALTGLDDRIVARVAVSSGAQDYVIKGEINEKLLINSIRYALERKKIEETLRESEAQYRELADSITDVFFAVDADLRYTYWNRASELLTGISAHNAVGKTLQEVFPEIPGRNRAEEMYRDVLKTQKPQSIKNPYHIKGKSYTFEIFAYPSRSGLVVFVKDITEKEKAEEALFLTQHSIDQSPFLVIWTDKDAQIRYANETTCNSLGYSKEELLSMKVFDTDADFTLARWLALWEETKNKKTVTIESYLKTKQGYVFPVEILCTYLEFRGQEYHFGFARDITNRRKAEQALRESENKYRRLFELESDAIFLIENETGCILEANNAASAMYGYSREELLAKKNTDLSAEPEDTQRVTQTTPIDTDKIVKIPLRFHRKKDGTVFPVEIMSRFFIGEGKTFHIAAIRDITERKQAEEALRKSEMKYRTLTENINMGIYRTTPGKDGIFLEANPAMAAMFGYTKEEILRLKACDLYDKPESRDAFFSAIDKNGYVKNVECTCKKKDGSTFIGSDSSVAVKDDKGNILFFDGILEDITERKNIEQMLIQSEKMASIGTLAAGVAHEINNPIGYILSNLKVLEKYNKNYEQFYKELHTLLSTYKKSQDIENLYANFLTMITNLKIEYYIEDMAKAISESLEGAERVKKIVSDLRDFARTEQYQIKPTDINIALDKTLNVLWNEIKYKADVVKDYGELPAVECDVQRISQVFVSILVNAIQALERKGTITIKTFVENRTVIIQISDTGVGISAKHRSKIFDAFFTTKDPGKGTGLGLSIALKIIQEHKGQITVESEKGKGTTFTIKLPITQTT